MRAFLLACVLLSSRYYVADALKAGKYCFAGCDLILNYVGFNDTSGVPKKVASCTSKLRALSLYLCIDEYCSDGGRGDWLLDMNDTCQRFANASLPPYSIVAEYGPEGRAALKRLSADEAFSQPILGEEVLPDEVFFQRAFDTLDAAYYEYEIHAVYGWFMLYFWTAVVSVGVLCRFVSLVDDVRRRRYQLRTDADGMLSRRTQRSLKKMFVLWKQHVAMPASFNNRCSEPIGWCTVPPRIQSLAIFSFVALNIILCTVDYRITQGNLYWPRELIQWCRYVSDRTGIISLCNFPLIWIFGMRNNVLMWATGWGFGTYNSFHRWVARVSTVQAVVHSLGYTVMVSERGGWATFRRYLDKHYFWNGELATISMCALLAFSVYGLRRRHYEVFLIVHIALSMLALLTMYYHVEIFTAGEWTQFLYPCLGVWILDRFLRIVRIVTFSPRFWKPNATVVYDESSNLASLEVHARKSMAKPKPGTYFYVHVLDNVRYAYQSHPFSLANVRTEVSHGGPHNRPPMMRRRHARSPSSERYTEADPLLGSITTRQSTSAVAFLIRPYDGFTSRLAQEASLGPKILHVLVEGPYGHTVPLRQYQNILFVVGGTGIAVTLSYLEDLLLNDSAVRSLRIVWAVREHAFLARVLDEFRDCLQDERVRLEVYLTQEGRNGDEEGHKRVILKVGRPDAHAVVGDAASEASHESLAIMACGPAQMADQARSGSVAALAKGFDVDYFEESFKW